MFLWHKKGKFSPHPLDIVINSGVIVTITPQATGMR